MSCWRTRGSEAAKRGTRRSRTRAFSGSPIGVGSLGRRSCVYQARLTRFLKKMTATYGRQWKVSGGGTGSGRTGEADAGILFSFKDAQQTVDKALMLFELNQMMEIRIHRDKVKRHAGAEAKEGI